MALQIITDTAKQRLVSYKDEFLAAHPNKSTDIDEEGNETPTYTDSEWLDEVVKRWLLKQLRNGDVILKSAEKKTFDLST